jgi:zona occludens toxin (predicted ATPase)
MKSALCLFFVLVTVTLCFFGCSNIPEEPATTETIIQSYVNPYGETAAAPINVDPTSDGATAPVQYVEKTNNVEFVLSSYYVYKNSVAKINNIQIEDDGISISANGYADVEMIAIGSKKENMKIGYTAYDKDGNVVRKNYVLANLDGVKEGEICKERRFMIPRDAVKVVFSDFVED